MANIYFQFKQFTIHQDRCAMKVTTDACLFGAWVAEHSEPGSSQVLDIGAGTGLLSLMLLQKHPGASIDAIELDKDCYAQAVENIQSSGFEKNISVIQGDARVFDPGKKYNLIVSNPPFYEKELKSDDPAKNRAHHSQDLSLKELMAIIKKHLNPEGKFYLLLPYKRDREISGLLKEQDFSLGRIVFVRQSSRHHFFRIMLEGKWYSRESETHIEEIAIWDEKQQYTPAFTALLKEYYLYL